MYKNEFQGYNGSHLIKRAGVKIHYTAEMIEEYMKCADPKTGPEYFIRKYVKIIHVDRGLINFEPFEYQSKAINSIHNNRSTILCWARQSGKSVTFCGYVLWYIIFNKAKTVAILANKQDTAVELLHRIQLAYSHLPDWLQPGVIKFNAKSFELENHSTVLAGSTGSGTIRGKSISLLILDETAFIEKWNDFAASTLPVISSGKETKIVMVSTPNGLNHFWKTWELAQRGENEFHPIMVKWYEVPGRDETWKRQVLSDLSHDEEKFAQEYEAEFMGSSGTLIAGWKLKELVHQIPVYDSLTGLKQYEKPIEKHMYALVADCGEGVGLDNSAFSVFDITSMPYKQVCTFKNNLITPGDYAAYIKDTAIAYNNAYVLPELNNIGTHVASVLINDLQYEFIFYTQSAGVHGRKLSQGFGEAKLEPGVKTTVKVKSSGCSLLKHLIEKNQLIINDYDTIYELSRFSRKNNSFAAEPGCKDDLVMSLVLFAWMTDQTFFREHTDIDTLQRLREKTEQQMLNELAHVGIRDTGHNQSEIIDEDAAEKWNEFEAKFHLTDDQIALLKNSVF
jgi:hypothetical protein